MSENAQYAHSTALRFALKNRKYILFQPYIFVSLLVSISLASFYFTDAATVETITPVTSQSWIGQTVKLTCTGDGAPTPALSWKNPCGRLIKKVIDLKNILHVLMSNDQDFGNYTCKATNDVNTDTRTVLVQQISKWNIPCSSIVHLTIIPRARMSY